MKEINILNVYQINILQHPGAAVQVFLRKVVLKICSELTGENPC